MRVILLLCTLTFCLGSSASHELVHLLAPKAKHHDDLDLDSIVPHGPIDSVFSEMHAHLEAGVGQSWYEMVTAGAGVVSSAVTGKTLQEKVQRVLQVSYAFADVLLTDGSLGLRGSLGTLGFSLGISIAFKAQMIPNLLKRAIAIGDELLKNKYTWTHNILKTMICKFNTLKNMLDSMSTGVCTIPVNELKFRLIFGGSVSAVGFTPLWEVDFPIFEDADGTPDGALCKMQTCVKDFFTGLKNKLLGNVAKSLANHGAEEATGFCSSSSLLETSTSVQGKNKASAGLGFKFLSSPALTMSLICKTDGNPITECGPLYLDFAKKAGTFVGKLTGSKKIANGDVKDLGALHKDRRPMGLPVENAPADRKSVV